MGCASSTDMERVGMFGLDDAGKTTILYRLKSGKGVETVPTIGFNVEYITFKNKTFILKDLGGQRKVREHWEQHTKDLSLIIWVIDSSNLNRIEFSKEELFRLLENESLIDVPLMIWANQTNCKESPMTTRVIEEKMELKQLRIPWTVQPCNAMKFEGLYEGLDWIVRAFRGDVGGVPQYVNIKSAG